MLYPEKWKYKKKKLTYPSVLVLENWEMQAWIAKSTEESLTVQGSLNLI